MITTVRRQGGRRWLTALLVSCLVMMIAVWRFAIATDSADGQLCSAGERISGHARGARSVADR